MSEGDEIGLLVEKLSPEKRKELFALLREKMPIGELHKFESDMDARAEQILEALSRAGALNLRAVRGCLSEATFFVDVVGPLQKAQKFEDITPVGDFPFDAKLKDKTGDFKVQVKLQRRKDGTPPWIRADGKGVAELQRTRTGVKRGKSTRPYRFGEFDILAVCMQPSHKRWNSFMYIPEKWLLPDDKDATIIEKMQPVSLKPDEVWTDDFEEAVRRLRSGNPRPGMPAPTRQPAKPVLKLGIQKKRKNPGRLK